MVRLASALVFSALPAFANAFERPVPQPQSATAELWYGIAFVLLCLALYAVYWVISKR